MHNTKVSDLERLEELISTYQKETDVKKKHVIYLNLIEESLKLVKKIVMTFYPLPNTISKDDLIQVGAVGVLRAIEAYRTEERGSFKTYVSKVIKGKIFHFNDLTDMSFYFCMIKLPSREIMIQNYEDYDSMNKSCFNSIFRNNLNKKDYDTYLRIKFSEILFIFKRKYCFRDNSLEIFTSHHKSYYFKFKNNDKRNKFLEHLISILNKNSKKNNKLYKPIFSIDENKYKNTLGYYKEVYNNSSYSNISYIKDLWKKNKISTLELLMWINIYGNRSFVDTSQFPLKSRAEEYIRKYSFLSLEY
jgi:hypothetical protein